jgi:protein-tyrosine phosphatase
VLFVCLGNICRSPTAHAVFRSKVRDARLQDAIHVDSAGTGSWHIGSLPDERSIQIAEKNGYDMSGLYARQICATDFAEFDYILAMDEDNILKIQLVEGYNESITLDYFLKFNSSIDRLEVPDPYYGKGTGFSDVLEMIEGASDGLLDHLKTKMASVK